jgi:hypothetical protein
MKKNSTLMLMLGLILTLSASALPSFVELPHTFNSSNTYGDIDIDGDETADFYVYFSDFSSSGDIEYMCGISPASGNRLLIEGVQDSNPMSGTTPLSFSSSPSSWVSILTYGTSIGPDEPGDSFWSNYGELIAWNYPYGGDSPAPSEPFTLRNNGYIGLGYYRGSELYYAWISVSVDNNAPSVTLGAAGSAPTPGTPILAGSGSGVVPVPLIASLIGFMAIGSGAWLRLRRKRKK